MVRKGDRGADERKGTTNNKETGKNKADTEMHSREKQLFRSGSLSLSVLPSALSCLLPPRCPLSTGQLVGDGASRGQMRKERRRRDRERQQESVVLCFLCLLSVCVFPSLCSLSLCCAQDIWVVDGAETEEQEGEKEAYTEEGERDRRFAERFTAVPLLVVSSTGLQ